MRKVGVLMGAPETTVFGRAVAPTTALGEVCFHCGELCARGRSWRLSVDDREVSLCCPGCLAATTAIHDLGLSAYYLHRERYGPRPNRDGLSAEHNSVYDDALMLARFATLAGDISSADLTLAGMNCAACAWLLESRLARCAGVESFEVNFATRRARVSWRAADTGLSRILDAVAALGYDARPFTPDARRAQLELERGSLLRALGVAALFGMQVMMIAFAFYTGGIDPAMQRFLRWTSLVLSVPVVTYCALPFYRSACHALRAGSLVMEVPVSVAIVLAYSGSVWNTWFDQDAVYYDSVAMFVTLLLASRFLEMRARAAASVQLETFAALVPDSACRVIVSSRGERFETVPAMRLVAGDQVLVRAGERMPADGLVVSGVSALDEAILTGESLPQTRGPGARVLGGSVNLESSLRVVVSAVAADSFAGHLAQLVSAATQTRPTSLAFSAQAARWFVAAVLLVGLATALFWSLHDSARWFSITLAVLVVSCPCALAIAVPAALAAAHARLLGAGIAVLDGRALEVLAKVTDCVFDKTGTLTTGQLTLRAVVCTGDAEPGTVLAIATALAQTSNHPIARALRSAPVLDSGVSIDDCASVTGAGLTGRWAGGQVALGSAAFMASFGVPVPQSPLTSAQTSGQEAWLLHDVQLLARFEFDDSLREDAPAVLQGLRQHDYNTLIMSGDREVAVAHIASRCGGISYFANRTPADKSASVAALQREGRVVLMVGDGVNDAPVLAQADVSIAMADSASSTRQQASILLLTPALAAIPRALNMARAARQVMRQNLCWAVLYNLIALPLAATGLLAPWAAALGMSVSSLVVVLNALRLLRA